MNWLLENTIVAGAGACVVFAVCRFFKPRPALAHVLWLLVLIKLLCPSVMRVSLPFELPELWNSIEAPTTAAPTPLLTHQLADLRPTVVLLRDGDSGGLPLAVTSDGALRAATSGVTSASSSLGSTLAAWSVREWFAAIWILGSLGMLGSMLLGIWRMRRIRRAGSNPSAWLRSEVEFLAQRLGIDTPRVIVSSRIGSAFVWGLGRPTLMWPTATADEHDLGKIRSVIAHELAHLRRRDHWTAWFEIASTITLWWHPLMWLSRSSLRLQAELACDAWAIWAVPDARHAYAGALIDAVEHESQAVTTVPVLAARPGARRAFEKRLLMILNEDVPRRLSSWAILPIAALSLTVLSGISFAQERQGKLEKRKVEKRKHDVKIEVGGIQADVLRKVSKELSKAFGKDVKIRNFDEIDRVVQRLVREQTRKAGRKNREDDRQDRPRRIVRRKGKGKGKGKENRKVEVRVHRKGDGGGEVEILEIENLLKGKLKKLEGLEGTIRMALKDANVEIMDLGGKLKLELHEELHGLGDTIREALKEARVHVLESDDFEVLGDDHRRMILRVLGGDGDKPKIHVLRGGKDVDVDVLLEKVRGKLHQHDEDEVDHKHIIRRVLGGKGGNVEVHVLRDGDAKFHVIRGGKGGNVNIEAIVKKALSKAHKHDDDHVRIIERVLGDKAGKVEVRVLRGGDAKFHVIRGGKGGDVNIEAIVKKALGKAHKHDDDHVRIIERVLGDKAGNIKVRVLHSGDARFHVIRGHHGHDVDVEAIIENTLGKHSHVIIRRGKDGAGSDKKHHRIIRLHKGDGDGHHIRILKDLDIDPDGILEGIGNIKIEGLDIKLHGLDGVIHRAREKQKPGRESKNRKKKLRSKKKIV